ncbi:hypothetical protein KGM_206367 [Danaus plexippus plexippus]|uniref:Uncharacterized protein n=1 Tax=Danaus plexippus plexippus TaxID=278856 RepID=A0A212FNG5_DANPL|nr:hypothetical protein KGM_206367 [Danaus plexippus plexippus]
MRTLQILSPTLKLKKIGPYWSILLHTGPHSSTFNINQLQFLSKFKVYQH